MALQGGTQWVKDIFLTAPPFMIILACFDFLHPSNANTLLAKSEKDSDPVTNPMTISFSVPIMTKRKKKRVLKKIQHSVSVLFFCLYSFCFPPFSSLFFLSLFFLLICAFSFPFPWLPAVLLQVTLSETKHSICLSWAQRSYLFKTRSWRKPASSDTSPPTPFLLFTEPSILFSTALPVVYMILVQKTVLRW